MGRLPTRPDPIFIKATVMARKKHDVEIMIKETDIPGNFS